MTDVTEIEAGGMTYVARRAGESGEPVILLHGFPETSIMWAPLMDTLAAEGHRCLAPDQRGYSPGARPDGADAYRYEDMAGDVFAFADAEGYDRFHLVGHDWGAIVGWAALGSAGAERIASWTSLSVPHYLAFAQAVRDDPEEELYRGVLAGLLTVGVFEGLATANDGAGLRGAYDKHPQAEIDEYLRVLSAPGAMAAACNWYRACRAHARALDDPSAPFGPVATPSLLLWGRNDPYIRRMSVDLAAQYMTGPYRLAEVDAGHWLVQEAPEQVTSDVLAHLRANAL